MAPSQHLRSMLGRTRTSRLAFPTAFATTLLLGATLALSACGAVQEARSAAIVNGTAISDQDLHTVAGQLNSINPEGQKNPLSGILSDLIIARFVLAEADRAHKTVSVADARKAYPILANMTDPSPSTMELFQAQSVFPLLDDASRASLAKELGRAKVTVNPRYGTFVAQPPFLVPISPNWLKPSATPPPN